MGLAPAFSSVAGAPSPCECSPSVFRVIPPVQGFREVAKRQAGPELSPEFSKGDTLWDGGRVQGSFFSGPGHEGALGGQALQLLKEEFQGGNEVIRVGTQKPRWVTDGEISLKDAIMVPGGTGRTRWKEEVGLGAVRRLGRAGTGWAGSEGQGWGSRQGNRRFQWLCQPLPTSTGQPQGPRFQGFSCLKSLSSDSELVSPAAAQEGSPGGGCPSLCTSWADPGACSEGLLRTRGGGPCPSRSAPWCSQICLPSLPDSFSLVQSPSPNQLFTPNPAFVPQEAGDRRVGRDAAPGRLGHGRWV